MENVILLRALLGKYAYGTAPVDQFWCISGRGKGRRRARDEAASTVLPSVNATLSGSEIHHDTGAASQEVSSGCSVAGGVGG
eukprot:363185-Chlamydomonas_euryale.AAC.1